MLRMKGSVEIGRPIEDVFAFVANPENFHRWQMGLHHVTYRPNDTGHGALTEVRKVMGRQVAHTLEISEQVDREKMVHRGPATTHSGEMERRIFFDELGRDRTRVAIELDIDTRGGLKSGRPIMERMVQRELDADLLHLKDILEAHHDLHDAMATLPRHPDAPGSGG